MKIKEKELLDFILKNEVSFFKFSIVSKDFLNFISFLKKYKDLLKNFCYIKNFYDKETEQVFIKIEKKLKYSNLSRVF